MNAEKALHQLKIAAIFFVMTLAVAAAGAFVLRNAAVTDIENIFVFKNFKSLRAMRM